MGCRNHDPRTCSENRETRDRSPVFNQLLQLLDLAAQLFRRREAFRHLHKKCGNLVAAQQAGDTALESVKHAGLHNSYAHKHARDRSIFVREVAAFLSCYVFNCCLWGHFPTRRNRISGCSRRMFYLLILYDRQVRREHRWHIKNRQQHTEYGC